jgi:iron complex outermembrane receptor protein
MIETFELRRQALLSGAALLALGALSSVASAQETESASAPQSTETSDAGVGDIVVTAQRREQRLTEVPISVQAVGAQALARAAFATTNDLLKLTPSVSFVAGASPATSSVVMRGIASIGAEGGVQPSTAVVVDEVPVSRQGEFVTDFGDVERIEVLRGPQGTLFGKNATAGVINIVNKKPSDRYEGSVEGGYTTDDEKLLRGVVNIPLGDRVRTRFNAYWRQQDQLLDNNATLIQSGNYKGTGGNESYGFAAKVAVDITDDVDILLAGDVSRQRSALGSNIVLLGDTNPALNALQTQYGIVVDRDHPSITNDAGSDSISKFWGVSGTLNARLSDTLSLKSVTSYRRYVNDYVSDSDSGPWGAWRGVGLINANLGYPVLYVMEANGGLPRAPNKTGYFSNETRFNYSTDSLDLIAGTFVQLLKDYKHNSVPTISNPASGIRRLSDTIVDANVNDDVYSVFADATYKIVDTVSLFGGLRYSHEKLKADYQRVVYSAVPFDPITLQPTVPGVLQTTAQQVTVNNLSGRAGVRFQPSRSHSYYASFSRGYKGPATDVSRSAFISNIFLKPEIATAFEVGTKHDLFDNRVNLNVSLFWQKTKDIQQASRAPDGGLGTRLQNAGDIVAYGTEIEMAARVTSAFRIDAALAYAHAEYRNLFNACYVGQTAATGCGFDINGDGVLAGAETSSQNLSGSRANGAPRWAANIAANYDVTLPENIPFDAFVRVAYAYQGMVQHGLQNDPLTREPSHGSLDATLGIVGKENQWQLLIYGRNLTNEVFYSRVNVADNFIGRVFGNITRDIKRYGGVQLKVSF